MFYDNTEYDPDIDAAQYCEQALTLFDRFKGCYNSDHVDSVVQLLLEKMQAVKINIHGNLYFIPNPHLPLLNIFEDCIEALSKCNLNAGNVSSNSMFVANDEKQREKMTAEFYMNYKRDIETYEDVFSTSLTTAAHLPRLLTAGLKKLRR